jgi:hypothetical protein
LIAVVDAFRFQEQPGTTAHRSAVFLNGIAAVVMRLIRGFRAS